MTEPGDPGQPAPTGPDGQPLVTRAFMCVLPCTNAPIKYLGVLDGCARGIHLTPIETVCPQVTVYQRMSDAIMEFQDQPSLQAVSPTDPCSVCKAPLVPRHTTPVFYLENCLHYFHDGCLRMWRNQRSGSLADCPQCGVRSCRAMLWPQLITTASDKNELFQLQKRYLGLEVSPDKFVHVSKSNEGQEPPAFRLNVNWKFLTVRKRPPPAPVQKHKLKAVSKANQSDQPPPPVAPEQKPPVLTEDQRREFLLKQIRCPLKPPLPECPNTNLGVNERPYCKFWHGWPRKAPHKGTQRLDVVHEFPKFYCVLCALDRKDMCTERIRVHPQELVRCLGGFHFDLNELASVNLFAEKMASQIMTPFVIPEPAQDALYCAFCKEQARPEPANCIRVHLQQCDHWLHGQCLQAARSLSDRAHHPNSTLELVCPICKRASMRTLAWPGQFPSDMVKQTIFKCQLENFLLDIPPDTKLAIGQVANQVNVFTVDVGGARLSIDAANAQNGTIFFYE